MSSGSLRNICNQFSYITYLICLYEHNFALNNLQELIGHKKEPTNQPTNI